MYLRRLKVRNFQCFDDEGVEMVHEVIDFIGHLRIKNERDMFKEFEEASKSSTDFWDNDIDDDEVWNNV